MGCIKIKATDEKSLMVFSRNQIEIFVDTYVEESKFQHQLVNVLYILDKNTVMDFVEAMVNVRMTLTKFNPDDGITFDLDYIDNDAKKIAQFRMSYKEPIFTLEYKNEYKDISIKVSFEAITNIIDTLLYG